MAAPHHVAEFEYTKLQLLGSLDTVAAAMRNAAQFVEQYAQIVASLPPYHPVPPLLPNGQLPQLPQQHVATPVADGKRKKRPEDDEGGKKKKDKKPKDPNAPKRPASSYLLFQNEVRQSIKEKHPNIANNQLLQMIAKAWAEMPQDQKDAYEGRQKLAKGHYLAEKAAYERAKGGPNSAGDDPASPISEPPPTNPVVHVNAPQATLTPVAKSTPAVAAVSSEVEDTSSEEEESSDSEADEQDAKPPTKKQKKAPTPPPEPEPKKKHKKTKA